MALSLALIRWEARTISETAFREVARQGGPAMRLVAILAPDAPLTPNLARRLTTLQQVGPAARLAYRVAVYDALGLPDCPAARPLATTPGGTG
jgi:hypothetical protein